MTAYRQTRCELDHRDGKVCLRRINWDGTCPGEAEHCPDDGTQHPHVVDEGGAA